jgi:transposase-like protein
VELVASLAAGELRRGLQRGLPCDRLRAAEAAGSAASKGGRRPAVPAAEEAGTVRASCREGCWVAALARDHGVSRGALRTAVAGLLPDHTTDGREDGPAPKLPVTPDMPGTVAGFLHTIEVEPAERAAGPARK